MKNSKYWHDEPVFQNRTPEYFYGYKCPYCGAKLKPIDEITLLCNTCNRLWFFHHLQEKGTEDW